MTTPQPFRFMDLPPELRLMVYERMPIVTRHHVILSEQYSTVDFTIISKRIPGISILGACRKIHWEADILRKKMDRARTFRIIVNWHQFGGDMMRAVLQCASPNKCEDRKDLNMLLQSLRLYQSLQYGDFDFPTQKELHAILHYDTAPNTPLRVEIAVGCGDDLYGAAWWGLHQQRRLFKEWISDTSVARLPHAMDIVLRPMHSYAIHVTTSADPFTGGVLVNDSWKKGSWRCSADVQIRLEEWEENWAAGVKY